MLLIGPAGSGKTERVLAELEAALGRGENAQLVAPTASMAEHLRHQLARRGLVIPPRTIQPLDGFVEDLTPGLRQASGATERLLLEHALAAAPVAEFAAVAAYAGFQEQLLATIQEFWSAGAEAQEVAALAGPGSGFARVMAAYEAALERAGAVHRARRFSLAAAALRRRPPAAVFFDGFFHLTAAELELVLAAVETSGRCLVTLPERGAEETRQALLDRGIPETVLDRVCRPCPQPVVVEAYSPEREVEDIAGRILADRAQTGRAFRDYGVIVRHPEVYAPLLAVVFQRLGIPLRASQAKTPAEHSSVRYLTGLLRAAAEGFDALQTLELLHHNGSGIAGRPELDAYDFDVRERAPGAGILFLSQLAAGFPAVREWILRLDELSAWAAHRESPAVWAARCASLAKRWFRLPEITDRVDHATALQWRELAVALELWPRAAAEAAAWLELQGASPVDLDGYLRVLETVLRLTRFRAPDRRRNMVQVLTAHEARQWELPVVFVCGLVEKQFPRHHAQNLFFPDGARRGWALRGVRLRTTDELDREERFLFDLATTRATEKLYLSYPTHGEDGADLLRSFFLSPWAEAALPAIAVRAREPAPAWQTAPETLQRPTGVPAERHERFTPSGLEQYIQCPFLFFADRTLRLQGPPPQPEERIDELLKGSIIHRTVARWTAAGGDIGPVFEQVFAETCEHECIRLNYRAEALKMELRADLERFARFEQGRAKPPGFEPGPPESSFQYTVEEGVERPFRITGRIDRYETSPGRAVVVVDYKYSRPDRLRRLCREQEQGLRVQAPLYLLGLERERGLTPAGMLFYGLRKEPSRHGWFAAGVGPAEPDLEALPPAEFRALLEAAAARTLEIVGEIRQGVVAVRPRDPQVCREYCRYREVCRVNL